MKLAGWGRVKVRKAEHELRFLGHSSGHLRWKVREAVKHEFPERPFPEEISTASPPPPPRRRLCRKTFRQNAMSRLTMSFADPRRFIANSARVQTEFGIRKGRAPRVTATVNCHAVMKCCFRKFSGDLPGLSRRPL